MQLLGFGGLLALVLFIPYLQKAEFFVTSMAAIYLASFPFPEYLFYVVYNVENRNREELEKLRSTYIRFGIIFAICVIIVYLMTVVVDEAIYIRDTIDSCDVSAFFFKFNIC